MIAAQLARFNAWLKGRGNTAWRACYRQEFLVELLGQRGCGLTTHMRPGVVDEGCGWCGAKL